MAMLVRILILGLAALQAGCVGYTYTRPHVTVIDRPRVVINQNIVVKTPGKPDFVKAYGEPTGKAGEDTLIFEARDDDWCGLVFWIGVPLPLGAFVCHAERRVQFQGDEAVQETVRIGKTSGPVCSPFIFMLTSMDHSRTDSDFCW
jgi:hypothetical protein